MTLTTTTISSLIMYLDLNKKKEGLIMENKNKKKNSSRIEYLMAKDTRFILGGYEKVVKEDHVEILDDYTGKVVAKIYKDKVVTNRKRNSDVKNYAENHDLEYVLIKDKNQVW